MTDQINGNDIAEEMIEDLEKDIAPRLEVIQVGNNTASTTYVKEKLEACEKAGFEANLTSFSSDVNEQDVLEKIRKFNNNQNVNGILVQLPLPEQINNDKIFGEILPEKDVDGLHPLKLGKTLRGDKSIAPCSVRAVLKIIETQEKDLKGKKVTIVNNSNLIGKPLSMGLTQKGATVTLCHKETENLVEHTREADILITATGQPGIISKKMVSEDCFVIDAGYEAGPESETEKVEDHVSVISPEPGGVGPVTVAMTLKNLVKCYNLQK